VVWSGSPDRVSAEALVWKDFYEGIKFQQYQAPAGFLVIRFRNASLIDNALHLLHPGTILVFEDTCSIEYVDAASTRQTWEGNGQGNVRWGHVILRWNGQRLDWVPPSTVSTQSSKRHWEVINRHTPREIVQSIISGTALKPPRNQRDGARRRTVKSPLQDIGQLQKMVSELQASISAKEETISNLQKQLEDVTAENRALRSGRITSVTPLSVPSVFVQHLPLETAFDHYPHQRLPSSLVPPVRCSFHVQKFL